MKHFFFRLFNAIVPAQEVFAHCDIPCGIYTAEPALTAAKTVVRMTELIQQLEPPSFASFNVEEAKNKINSLVRYIAVKEQHAQKCKEELLILWTDYFKPEHLETFPQLHETFWKAAKSGSVHHSFNFVVSLAVAGLAARSGMRRAMDCCRV